MVGAFFPLLPDISRALLFQSPTIDAKPLSVRAVATALTLLEFPIYVQWLVAVALVFREQPRHLNLLVGFFLDFFGWFDLI